MESLVYLSQRDADDDDDGRRPTPLDPEYWRGVTHSFDSAPNPAFLEDNGGQVPYNYRQQGCDYERPVTAPPQRYAPPVGGGYPSNLVASPVHYQDGPHQYVPVSPVAHGNFFYGGMDPPPPSASASLSASYAGFPTASATPFPNGMQPYAVDWGTASGRSHLSVPPQHLKAQVRDAFVRARAYLDLIPFFQSCDLSALGGISSHTLQEALSHMGVMLPSHLVQAIAQLFGIPGRGVLDYVAFSQFLELDARELDDIRSVGSARRAILLNAGIDLNAIFIQEDPRRTGCVPRSTFALILRKYGFPMSEGVLHFLIVQLSKSLDTTSVSYIRFLEMIGASGYGAAWPISTSVSAYPVEPVAGFNSWSDARYPQAAMNNYDRRYDPQIPVAPATRRESFVDLAAAAPALTAATPQVGWVCRVCAHQQVADWVTHCEICETSRPRQGRHGEGFIKCSNCQFDNNYDSEECEMCGRPLPTNNSRQSSRKKKHKSKGNRSARSDSSRSVSSRSSSSSSDSSRRSRRQNRSPRRKVERKAQSAGSRRVTASAKPKFQRGEEVQAVPLGERDFEIGVICRVHSNGTYDIEFDNGQYEKHVDEASISEISRARIVRTSSTAGASKTDSKGESASTGEFSAKFDIGDRIEARFQGGERYFGGTIKKCRTDGSYDIEYDDSELEERVRAKYIRPQKVKSPKKPTAQSTEAGSKKTAQKDEDTSSSEVSFTKGQRVEVKLNGSSEFIKAKVFRPHLDGTCDVELDTGELEKKVPNGRIRLRTSSSPVKPKPKLQSDDEPAHPKRPVKKPAPDSSTDDSSAKPAAKFKQGQEVEAKFKGGDKYYCGVIARCRLNGSYDINYDDGEKESAVSAALIRAKGPKSPAKKNAPSDTSENDQAIKFAVGQKIEARFKGEEKYYPGVISRCRLNGAYDIEYDDGEKENAVRRELIRAKKSAILSKSPKAKDITSSSDEIVKKKFAVGQKIEAQYKGKSKYYPGVISRCRLNGTYDIDYDDGEKETGVAVDLIRLLGKSSPSKKVETSEDEKSGKATFKEGEKVEAQYKGKSKYYPGVISRCRSNGTYDIDYDDGEKETYVGPQLIRSLKSSSPSKKAAIESEDEKKPSKKFKEGEKVEAQYKGKSKFYPGVISRCRLNGSYDIDYDDGEKETGVAADLIRSREPSSSKKAVADSEDEKKPSKKFKEGEKVEAQYKGKSKFYPGVISRCRLNGSYDIDYDDGEKETGVAADLIRSREPSSSKKAVADSEDEKKPSKKFKEGEKVEAQYKGKSKFYPGVISRCRLNGSYDIDYDDGEKETGVAADLIRSREPSSSKKAVADSEDEKKPSKKFKEGEKVEAQYKGKSKFYPGVISRCRLNGSYDIDYDDGEKETGVAADLIRSREPSSSKKAVADSEDEKKPSKKFKEGEKVEAQYKGKSKFYPGVISRCRLNGSYDIDYDDGEKETGVAADLIRSRESSSSKDTSKSLSKKFKEGDKVEAQYKGKSKFYPGVISRCRLNGTFDVDYDDGEKETGVDADLIRLKADSSSDKKTAVNDSDDAPKSKKFREGDKVDAQYKGKSKYYPGVISRCRLNGTYDVDYDDGEKETGVAPEFIRQRDSTGDGAKKKSGFSEGDKVEVQYKGKSKYYPGVISRCRLNGTYDIDYDDGEKETGVAVDLIRLLGKSSPSKKVETSEDEKSGKATFKEGEKVEAQYKGKSKYYPGVISRCRSNGTYDIDYDDGEKETYVGPQLIRSLKSSSPSKKAAIESEDEKKPSKKFKEGEKVEAQYKGKSKFYPGVISRCRLNGSYDIDYDDGEKETGVAADLIRSREPSSSKKAVADSEDEKKPSKKFKEGEKVEAQYKGKSKFYPGVISRCRLNGSYDIDYDDGEKETGVAADLIRSREPSSSKKAVADSEDEKKPSKKFKEGEKVEAQYKGKSKFYPGVISRCRLNGSYDIDYDDGEKETGVAADLIRSREPSSSKKAVADSEDEKKPSKKFKEGEKVEAQYKGKSKFYPGVISRCRLNGSYDIDYDDGEKETGVAADLIRSREPSSSKKAVADSEDEKKPSKKFKEGEKVEAQYKGKSKFYPGVISRCRLNGSYDIDYDDGEKETGVAADLIRSREPSSSKKAVADSEDEKKPSKKFKEGEKVEAQYKGKSKFYPGVISRCRLNGSYDIDYDDGEKETGVAADLIRSRESSSSKDTSKSLSKKFKEGDKVEAQYKGKSKFYPGVISRCRLNGTFDVDYDDGEKETGVDADLIRLKADSSSDKKTAVNDSDDAPKSKKFREGDKVDAQYKGKSKYYPGVISRCRLNGTYDVDYDDGEKETGVAPEFIRQRDSTGDGAKKKSGFSEGDKVEVQYKGKSKYYPGVISRCRLNGTYDIDYDDGEKETGVAVDLIRLLGKSSPSKKVETSEDEKSGKATFKEGEKVEAQYKGKSKYYPGVISRCRSNGTYDIDYDDGEKETYVGPQLIRSLKSSSPSKKAAIESEDEKKPSKKFKEGEKVEAQYKGKSKFYPGVISRCRLNGSYDIDYDDGEKETGVAADLIRSREPSSSKKAVADSEDEKKPSKKFKEGEKVEAQYKGKSKFYPGVISRCRLNGSYDIDYDDGEKETGVAADLIRSREPSSSKKAVADSEDEKKPSKKFKEGEKVEAQYKGKSKFYPGVISRCRLNGSYDIDYDDGEKETGVAADLIRSLSKSLSNKDNDFSSKKPTSRVDSHDAEYRVGTRVEALYMGKDKYFKGTISRAHPDGTYDIEYDDGDKENRVASKCIRPLKSSTSFGSSGAGLDRPIRPSSSAGGRRRSGNSSD